MPNNYRFPGQCVGAEGCPRPVAVKMRMLCDSHYAAYSRNKQEKVCTLEWCEGRYYAKGYCQSHWQRQADGLPINDPRIKHTCMGPDCDREVVRRSLCKTHYSQKWHGKELTPIRPRKEIPEREGQRWCKTCDKWKDRDADFYKTSRGSKQGECKSCMIKRNGANNLRRKLEKQGVEVE